MTVLQIKQGAVNFKSLYNKDDEEHDLILAVAKQLNVKTSVEMETIRAILFPSILCAAVFTGDFLLLCFANKTYFVWIIAESFYNVNYGSSIIMSKVSNNLSNNNINTGVSVVFKTTSELKCQNKLFLK